MPVREIVGENKQKMNKAVEILHDELRSVRTGRASAGLVENIRVDYYGTPTPLKQMATMAAPQVDMDDGGAAG
jgi:ribosome recycling factor